MAIRQMTGKRLSNNSSIPNRKVAPATISDVSIHSFGFNDQKSTSPKNFKQEKLDAGLRAVENHNYTEAVKQFSLIKPDTIDSLFLCGCSRLELKHYLQTQEAIVDFTNCIELSSRTEQTPFSLEVWYKRALAYHNSSKYDDAIKDYNEFIDRCRSLGEQGKSNLLRGLVGRGLTYQSLYELDMALKDMNEANKLSQNKNPYYLLCRASVYASRDEREEVVEDLQAASDLSHDHNVEVLFQRAIVLAELGRHNAAVEDLRKALKHSGKPIQDSDICYQCGLNDYALNNKEQAFTWFGRAINLHPYHDQANYHLGMMQTEKGQYKDALKTLTRAYELSPEQGDILLERAIVNQHLGKLDDAEHDRKRGMQLNLSSFAIIKMLIERIKKVRKEINHTGISALGHLELAMAYDGLLSHKKDIKARMEHYQHAVIEYEAAIESDTKNLYPQAFALLALCQEKMNDFIKAHGSHLDFYDVLDEHKGAEYHWKTYLLDIKTKMETGKLDPHLDENAVSKLIHMESNRRKKDIDEETFQNDTQDRRKNQLIFYKRLRINLSHILTAIGILNFDSDTIVHNAGGTTNRVSKIIELISNNETSVPEIESILNSDSKVSAKALRKINYDIIKMKLKSIGNGNDMTDRLDVAQLVARHLCTRYRTQLICLKSNSDTVDDEPVEEEEEVVEEVSPSSSWWKCCSSGGVFSSEPSKSSDENEAIAKIVTFAIAFIIHTINSETVQVSSSGKSSRRDALATILVLIISRARRTVMDTSLFSSLRLGNEKLPIDLPAVYKMLGHTKQSIANEITKPIEWNLYEFFRAPGIYYRSHGDTGKLRYYASEPPMMPNLYGYRLGTREEVDLFEKLNKE